MDRNTFLKFVTPSIIVMVLLMVIPLFMAIWLSFNFVTYTNLDAPRFVSLSNYKEILADPDFWLALRFSFIYILIIIPSKLLLGLLIALLLDQVKKRRGIYIACLLVPFILTPVVGTLMFRTLFDRGGLIYFLLERLFNYKFLLNTQSVRFLIIAYGVWAGTPFSMITLFAGLLTLPKNSMEAATVDGATAFQKLWYVVFPHLKPLITFITLIGIMDAYRIFDPVLVMTRGNPAFKAETLMYYNYRIATSVQRLGKANAMSVLTIIGIFIVLIPFLRLTYKEQMEKN